MIVGHKVKGLTEGDLLEGLLVVVGIGWWDALEGERDGKEVV
jgi:hypothetical protein